MFAVFQSGTFAHRKRQLAQHPELTQTGLYNVVAALRASTPLTAKEKTINELGLCGVLRDLHDQLDAQSSPPTAGRSTWTSNKSCNGWSTSTPNARRRNAPA